MNLYIAIFGFLILFSCSDTKIQFPKVEKGILDLSTFVGTDNRVGTGRDLSLHDYPIPLQGEWEFYWNELYTSEDFLDPTKRSEIEKKREWMKVPLSIPERQTMEKPGMGFATYRILLKGDNLDLLNYLYLKQVHTAYKIYSNGVFVFELAKVSKTIGESQGVDKPQIIKLQNLKKGELEIILQISNYNHRRPGIIDSPKLGTDVSIYKLKQNHLSENFFFFGAFFILSLYHLSLFLLRRKDLSPLYFSIFSFLLGLRPLLTGKYILDDFSILSWELIFKLEYLTVSVTPSIFVLFFQALYPMELSKKISNGIVSLSIFSSFLVIFGSTYFVSGILIYLQMIALGCTLLSLWILIRAVLKNSFGSKSLLFGAVCLFIAIVNDILHQKIIYTGFYLSYGLFIFIFSQAYLLSKRFSNAFQESEEQRTLLAQAKSEIEKLSKTKDEFLANLSHELKTPLSIVFAYSQMLPTNKENPKKVEKYSEQIFQNASKLNDYVSDLILVTDIESNLELQKINVELSEIIQENISSLSKLAEEKSITIETETIPNISIFCDPILCRKAIHAILKNSILYNKKGGSVRIKIQMDGEFLHLFFVDTGIGMQVDMLDRIFDKFFRIDASLNYEVSGVGIGLFLAKKIIGLHGGEICVQSKFNVGSEFIVSLPINKGIKTNEE